MHTINTSTTHIFIFSLLKKDYHTNLWNEGVTLCQYTSTYKHTHSMCECMYKYIVCLMPCALADTVYCIIWLWTLQINKCILWSGENITALSAVPIRACSVWLCTHMLKRGGGSEQAGNGTARTLTTRGAGATTGPAVIEGTHLIASKVPKGCVQFVGLIATACCNMFASLEPRAMRSLHRSAGNGIYVVNFKYSVMYTIQYGLQISVMLFKKTACVYNNSS